MRVITPREFLDCIAMNESTFKSLMSRDEAALAFGLTQRLAGGILLDVDAAAMEIAGELTPGFGRKLASVLVRAHSDMWLLGLGRADTTREPIYLLANEYGEARRNKYSSERALRETMNVGVTTITEHDEARSGFADHPEVRAPDRITWVNLSSVLQRIRARAAQIGLDLSRPVFPARERSGGCTTLGDGEEGSPEFARVDYRARPRGAHRVRRYSEAELIGARTIGRVLRRSADLIAPVQRSYDAAGPGKRWPGSALMPSPVTESLNARAPLASKAAYHVANNPHIAAGVSAWINNLVGDGPVCRHPDQQIMRAWNRFYSNCDASSALDLCGLTMLMVQSWLVTGEGFAFMVPDPEDGAVHVQLIPSAQVDESRNIDLGGGHTIVSGIETFRGKPLAYWVLPTSPDSPFANASELRPIPAPDMIHMFLPPFPGSVRGVSQLAPVLTRAQEIDAVEDALNALARVCALFGLAVSDPNGNFKLEDVVKDGLLPGGVFQMPPDATVSSVSPPQFDTVVDYVRHGVRTIAAGMGLPDHLVSQNLGEVNYSSARVGLLEFRRRVVALQKTLLVGQFLNKVFKRFVALEVLNGRLAVDLEALEDPTFIFTGWQPLDAEKETAADVLAISARLKSRFEVISARGRDPSEIDQEIAADPTPLPAPTVKSPIGESANAA